MATFKYIIREIKGKGASIHLVFNYGANKRLRYATKLTIKNKKNWSVKLQKVKDVIEESNKHRINKKLREGKTDFLDFFDDLVAKEKNIDNTILKIECDKIYRNKVVEVKETKHLELIPFFEWYLTHYDINPLPRTGKPLGKGTIRTYKNTLNKLHKYIDEHEPLAYKDITLQFYYDFLGWLYDNNYSTNYIGTIIKILKTIMEAAYEFDYHNNLEYKGKYFVKPTEDVYNIYLSQNELEKIFNLPIPDSTIAYTNNGLKMSAKFLDNARDLFLIGANTGLRVSDFNRLTKENIYEDDGKLYFDVTIQKTNRNIAIPINWMVSEILKKNDGMPPKRMADQHINYAIKHLGMIAGLKDKVTKEITKGGKKVIKTYKKFQMICNHTARRSFCTNAYMSDMATVDIMAISGHSTEKVFYSYIKIDHKGKAKKISKHDFFANKRLNIVS